MRVEGGPGPLHSPPAPGAGLSQTQGAWRAREEAGGPEVNLRGWKGLGASASDLFRALQIGKEKPLHWECRKKNLGFLPYIYFFKNQ